MMVSCYGSRYDIHPPPPPPRPPSLYHGGGMNLRVRPRVNSWMRIIFFSVLKNHILGKKYVRTAKAGGLNGLRSAKKIEEFA